MADTESSTATFPRSKFSFPYEKLNLSGQEARWEENLFKVVGTILGEPGTSILALEEGTKRRAFDPVTKYSVEPGHTALQFVNQPELEELQRVKAVESNETNRKSVAAANSCVVPLFNTIIDACISNEVLNMLEVNSDYKSMKGNVDNYDVSKLIGILVKLAKDRPTLTKQMQKALKRSELENFTPLEHDDLAKTQSKFNEIYRSYEALFDKVVFVGESIAGTAPQSTNCPSDSDFVYYLHKKVVEMPGLKSFKEHCYTPVGSRELEGLMTYDKSLTNGGHLDKYYKHVTVWYQPQAVNNDPKVVSMATSAVDKAKVDATKWTNHVDKLKAKSLRKKTQKPQDAPKTQDATSKPSNLTRLGPSSQELRCFNCNQPHKVSECPLKAQFDEAKKSLREKLQREGKIKLVGSIVTSESREDEDEGGFGKVVSISLIQTASLSESGFGKVVSISLIQTANLSETITEMMYFCMLTLFMVMAYVFKPKIALLNLFWGPFLNSQPNPQSNSRVANLELPMHVLALSIENKGFTTFMGKTYPIFWNGSVHLDSGNMVPMVGRKNPDIIHGSIKPYEDKVKGIGNQVTAITSIGEDSNFGVKYLMESPLEAVGYSSLGKIGYTRIFLDSEERFVVIGDKPGSHFGKVFLADLELSGKFKGLYKCTQGFMCSKPKELIQEVLDVQRTSIGIFSTNVEPEEIAHEQEIDFSKEQLDKIVNAIKGFAQKPNLLISFENQPLNDCMKLACEPKRSALVTKELMKSLIKRCDVVLLQANSFQQQRFEDVCKVMKESEDSIAFVITPIHLDLKELIGKVNLRVSEEITFKNEEFKAVVVKKTVIDDNYYQPTREYQSQSKRIYSKTEERAMAWVESTHAALHHNHINSTRDAARHNTISNLPFGVIDCNNWSTRHGEASPCNACSQGKFTAPQVPLISRAETPKPGTRWHGDIGFFPSVGGKQAMFLILVEKITLKWIGVELAGKSEVNLKDGIQKISRHLQILGNTYRS